MIEELLDYSELEGLIKPEHLPSAEASRCFVSRDADRKITGYIFSQIMVTVEPIWVDEKERGTNLALKLFGHAAESLLEAGNVRYFVTHSDSEKVYDYLKRLGLEEMQWKTFKMELRKTEGG